MRNRHIEKLEMFTFKQTNKNKNQIFSDYVIQIKGAFLSIGACIHFVNFIFTANTDSENTSLLLNN